MTERPSLILIASVKRSAKLHIRNRIPSMFRILGDPRSWSGFGTMNAAKRERLATAYDRWQASLTAPPSASER
jgi:hypothetical protein